jgi:hypothetical protein
MRSAKGSTNCPVLKESDIQIQVADWLRLYESARDFIFFACSNEAMGEAKTGAGLGRMARLKRMGLRPGVADIVIIRKGRAYFLELKTLDGVQSERQQAFQADCYYVGAEYEIAHSFEEAQAIVKKWKILE